ncbi:MULTISPECIES: pimeloyl-ACP methyl esterase BioG family protein [unclassified Helicobacter]|uniref:pimeloyl-ACP methyl esterase BioG family protein n=1 Tax=unclassified Helicobacter TaxID=2593540 RepID=UPI000CF1AB10|nr:MULTISPECIES: pimeloyl-ACP methyl esterase BioG family protein [unclassified Helicobacter]
MKVEILNSLDYQEAIVFFSGFGNPKEFFSHLTKGQKTIVFVSDYQDNSLDLSFLKDKKITLVAWSMGVAIANRFLPNNLEIKKRVAINGTLEGIHPSKGISPAVFRYTIKHFDLEKFKANLFGDDLPQAVNFNFHHLESLIKELENLYNTLTTIPYYPQKWDRAIVSIDDKIFASKNQIRSWETCQIIKKNAPHFVFLNFKSWDDFCNL